MEKNSPNIAELGKNTRFSKDRQPPAENKRVPKWKYQIRKKLREHLDEMLDGMINQVKDNGNPAAFRELMDRAFGKVKEEIEANADIQITIKRDYDLD